MVNETRSASRKRIRTKKRERMCSLKIKNIEIYKKHTHNAHTHVVKM